MLQRGNAYPPKGSGGFPRWSMGTRQGRTSNVETRLGVEIGEFILRDRNALPVYKLAEYLIQNSMLDVGPAVLAPVAAGVRRSSFKPARRALT